MTDALELTRRSLLAGFATLAVAAPAITIAKSASKTTGVVAGETVIAELGRSGPARPARDE